MPPPSSSLSKKQQKTAQFRSGGGGKKKKDGGALPADLPENDLLDDNGRSNRNEDDGEAAQGDFSDKKINSSAKGKGKAKPTHGLSDADGEAQSVLASLKKPKQAKGKAKAAVAGSPRGSSVKVPTSEPSEPSTGKRKREDVTENAAAPQSPDTTVESGAATTTKAKRTTFEEDGQARSVYEIAGAPLFSSKRAETSKEDEEEKDADSASTKKGKAGSKFIVFVGNMSFKTKQDDIAKHFASHCGETPSVRLLTKKVDPAALATLSKSKQKSIAKGKASHPAAGGTSRGCAFVEFVTPTALQKALRFHHSFLDGRQINVELTAGGGGKTEGRKKKIEDKNLKLDEQRKKLHDKYVKPTAGKGKDKAGENGAAAAQNATPAQKRQKTNDTPGEGAAQWGRQASDKPAGRKMPRWMASGANAVKLQD